MGINLIDEILDHPNPNRVFEEVQSALAREKIDRAKFREWLKPDVKAEFINGEVITHSPARRRHNQAVRLINFLIDSYITERNLGEVAVEKAMVELERNDFEPDVCFWSTETAAQFKDDMLYYPRPDLVIEVLSQSTQARDRGIKFRSYEEAGVSEYWIVDAKKHRVEQFVRGRDRDDRSVLLPTAELAINDQLTSRVLSGFFVPVRAFFEVESRGAVLRGWREEE